MCVCVCVCVGVGVCNVTNMQAYLCTPGHGSSDGARDRGGEAKAHHNDDDDVLDASHVVHVVHPCGGTVRYSAIPLDRTAAAATALAMGDVSAFDATLTSAYAGEMPRLGGRAGAAGANDGNGAEGDDMADVTIAFLGATARTCLEQVCWLCLNSQRLHYCACVMQVRVHNGDVVEGVDTGANGADMSWWRATGSSHCVCVNVHCLVFRHSFPQMWLTGDLMCECLFSTPLRYENLPVTKMNMCLGPLIAAADSR